LKPARRHVLGQHGTTDINREHQAQRAGGSLYLSPTGSGPREPNRSQKRGDSQQQRRPPSPAPCETSEGRRPPPGESNPLPASQPGTACKGERHDRRQDQD
jgi:hypothetical protein